MSTLTGKNIFDSSYCIQTSVSSHVVQEHSNKKSDIKGQSWNIIASGVTFAHDLR